MKDKKNQMNQEAINYSRGVYKPMHQWLAQYDEEADFLSASVSNTVLELTDEE